MLCTGWRLRTLAMGAWLALAGIAAGDDTFDLKLRKAPGVGNVLDEIPGEARARADDDDVEDVTLRYSRGYSRGYNGTYRYFPRFYAFRAGYYDGLSGRGYSPRFWGAGYGGYGGYRNYYGGGYGGYGRYGYGGYGGGGYGRYGYGGSGGYGGYGGYGSSYYSSYYSSYSYPAYTSFYYSAPVICDAPDYYVGISDTQSQLTPATRLAMPKTTNIQPMPEPEQPPMANPAPAAQPTYRYNGDATDPRPLPPQPGEPAPKNVKPAAPKLEAPEGRLVKFEAAPAKPKKLTYPAYGDHLRKADNDEVFVKQPKK